MKATYPRILLGPNEDGHAILTNEEFAPDGTRVSFGARPPGAGADLAAGPGTWVTWSNPGNITVEDGNFATATVAAPSAPGTHLLYASNFGFALAAASQITGIFVEIKGFQTSVNQENIEVVLTDGSGNQIGNYKVAQLASSNGWIGLGGTDDLWGWGAVAASDINGSGFGFVIFCNTNATTATFSFDYAKISIYGISGSLTGYVVYDNNATGNVTLSAPADATAPNTTGFKMKVDVSAGGESPGLGGFGLMIPPDSGTYALNTYHRGSTIIWRIRANIPIGYTIQFASNAYGTGGIFTWNTATAGTGAWFEYVATQIIGATGSFSSTGFFYLATGSAPVAWYVARVRASVVLTAAVIFTHDLYSITLANGQTINATDGQLDIVWNGTTFYAVKFGKWNRGQIESTADFNLQSATMELTFIDNDADAGGPVLFPGLTASMLRAIYGGLFDGAQVSVFTVYMPTYGDVSLGVETKFLGNVTAFKAIDRSHAILTVNDMMWLLQQPCPPNVYQSACRHSLFNANCALAVASFQVARTVGASSTNRLINLTVALAAIGNDALPFTQGVLTFTSGLNTGLSYSVRQQISTTQVLLDSATFDTVQTGDTMTIIPGCDKQAQTCSLKYSNLVHFGGQPYTPVPETVL